MKTQDIIMAVLFGIIVLAVLASTLWLSHSVPNKVVPKSLEAGDRLTSFIHRMDDIEEYILNLKCTEMGGITYGIYQLVDEPSTIGCKVGNSEYRKYGLEWAKIR